MNKMKKRISVFLAMLTVLASFNFAFAQSVLPPGEHERQQILQQQEQEKQYKENIRNILETQRVRDSRVKEGIVLPEGGGAAEDIMQSDADTIYKFDKIVVIGNKIFSGKTLHKAVLKQFLNKPINKYNVSLLQSMLLKYYISRGYITTKVYFDPEQINIIDNKETGQTETTFIVIVEEGKTGKISLEQVTKDNASKTVSKIGKFRNNARLFFAFPFAVNKPVNMNVFEQGLDQMNRLQSNNVTMEIAPAADKRALEQAYSNIVIINNQNPLAGGVASGARTTFLNLNYNNGGSKSTGEQVLNLSVSQDNLLSINDNIYISYTENSDSLFNLDKKDSSVDYGQSHAYKTLDMFNNDDEKKKFSKALQGAVSFPFGYWTLNASLNYSNYKSTVEGQYTRFHITGQSLSQAYTLDRVIYRTQIYKLNFGSGVEIKDTESYIRDVRSETGSGRRSNVSVYFNNVIYTSLGTIILKPSYQRGVSWFGSKTDADTYMNYEMLSSDPRLEYNLLKLYLYFNTGFSIPLLTKNKNSGVRNRLPLSYTLTIDSQYSFNSLYGANQFSVGGEYSTRGFKESSISGDNGFYARNDFKVNALQLMPNVLTGSAAMKYKTVFLLGDSLNSLLAKTHLSVFYDFGYVEDKYEDIYDKEYNSKSGYMMGAGASLNYYGQYINMSLVYAKGLHSPKYLQTRDNMSKEEEAVYWKVGVSW
ncbi:ShlB/FhaC/HecB family hemolysin secretion/activation protein [Endomicrobium proavitum]|uniref:Uncharacterized protein n=1 Tax=Endomicrobium proavitum TaxID=1408281 RepID=A0A0G3WIT2_9BACT|nr:ShlB/FhaC/HecB family hemolysin secretion/activation protein [Endomicrobium proavitum]AKL98223.1 exported protein of unknown function [Endomicrobium proavitum]